MIPSPWLYDFLKARTPFRPTAWRVCRHAPWTLGYGHRGDVVAGGTITMEQADELLRIDVDMIARAVTAANAEGLPSQGRFDLLVAREFAGF